MLTTSKVKHKVSLTELSSELPSLPNQQVQIEVTLILQHSTQPAR